MPPKSNVPIRIGGSKVRSGCTHCKRRHLKCDERLPTCVRCEKANLECTYVLRQEPTVSVGPSAYRSQNVLEVAAMKSFRMYLAIELSGSFPNSLWHEILPRIAEVEPVVWDAIVATSMLDTSIQLGQSAGPAIEKYDKTIRSLRTRIERSSHGERHAQDVVLVTSVLLAIFESLQANIGNAYKHINGALRLLKQWSVDGDHGGGQAYIDRAVLEPILLNLGNQGLQMGVSEDAAAVHTPMIDQQEELEPTFASVNGAYRALKLIWNRISLWSHYIDPRTGKKHKPADNVLEANVVELKAQLRRWDAAVESQLPSTESDPAAALLVAHRKITEVYFNKHIGGPGEMEWDKYSHQFEDALMYFETYTALVAERSSSQATDVDHRRLHFTVEMDIVLPLFLIGSRCRDASVRRRACLLLKTCRRREGIWDAAECAGVCETIWQLEEDGADDDGNIPESARVYELEVTTGEEPSAAVVFKRECKCEERV